MPRGDACSSVRSWRSSDCEVVCGEEASGQLEVAACFAADLMSDVLAFSAPDSCSSPA